MAKKYDYSDAIFLSGFAVTAILIATMVIGVQLDDVESETRDATAAIERIEVAIDRAGWRISDSIEGRDKACTRDFSSGGIYRYDTQRECWVCGEIVECPVTLCTSNCSADDCNRTCVSGCLDDSCSTTTTGCGGNK